MTRLVILSTLLLVLAASAAAGAPPAPATTDPGQIEISFTPFSHLDFFWGGTREECLARGNRIIAKAIRIANQSPKFRFLLESSVFVSNFVETHKGSQELEDFKRLVKEGRIEIAPIWTGIFQTLPDGEVNVRNLVIGKRFARSVFGIDPRVAHLGDLPDYTPQYPQVLSQSGVPFMVMTRMGPSTNSLFRWKAPDGSKALVWSTLKGYGWGTFLSSTTQLDEEKRARFRKDVAEVSATTPGPMMMNWGTDLWAPPDDLVARVEAFNKSAPANLVISTPTEFFARAEKATGIAELSGEIPSSWPNIVSSLPHLWPTIVPATNTLLAAEKFAAINHALGYADYPQQEFDLMWKKLVESMDHNHDGQGGMIGDGRKMEYQQLAVIRGGEILRDSLRNIAERVQAPIANSFPIVVFNPLGWTRDDVVRTHVTLYGDVSPADLGAFRKGMKLLDEKGQPVAFHLEQYSENISRAVEIVFVAKDVPSIGYRTYYLVASEEPEVRPNTAQIQLDRLEDVKNPRRAVGSDVVESEHYRVSVDRATGRVTVFDKALKRNVSEGMEIAAVEERGGNYIGIEPLSGRTILSMVDDIRVEENNPVRTVIKIALHLGDIPIEQRLILYSGLKRLDIENTVDWKTQRFIRLQQWFPLSQPNPKLTYGIPFGANSSDNVLPNSGTHAADEIPMEDWRRSRHFHDWMRAGNDEWGLTIAADHQQMRFDDQLIRAEMLRGVKFTSVKVVRGEDVGSMAYPVPGRYVFRYSLSSSTGDWKSTKAYRTGMNFTNPLAAVSVVDAISRKTLAPAQSFVSVKQDSVVISTIKKADAGNSVLLRVYEIEGKPVESAVDFLGTPASFTEVNLIEEDVRGSRNAALRAGPYSIRTLKLEPRGGTR